MNAELAAKLKEPRHDAVREASELVGTRIRRYIDNGMVPDREGVILDLLIDEIAHRQLCGYGTPMRRGVFGEEAGSGYR